MGWWGKDIRDCYTYIALGEITTLEHELGNHTVEDGAAVSKVVLAGAELPEVPSGAGNSVIEELEDNLSSRSYIASKLVYFLFL